MGGGQQELKGPDLVAGIPANEVADGAMLLGHANGEAVLIARRGDELFAIGATCTHYGGPLAEGLLVEDTVRCPWHHACFSLRTGEPVGAPALNPVACWRVERAGDRVRVTEKLERDPLAPSDEVRRGVTRTREAAHAKRTMAPSTQPPEDIVIIGAGAAGNAAAETLRREGYEGSITMVDPDRDAPYDRPNLSKDYLAGNAPEEWIPLHPASFYEEHRIDIVRARARRIDRPGRTVELDDARRLPFDALVLATGAEPNRLSVPVDGEVYSLRSLADSRAIVRAAEGHRRAAVIGASFIGLEVAASLRARGLEVHVIAMEERPLERILGPELGDAIRAEHEASGIVFHLNERPKAIERGAVVLESGGRVEAEFVVAGIGVKPRLELAESAGLSQDRGVTVNQFLETSVPGIYAAGDIARWPDPHTGKSIRVEHWVVAERQGQTVARNILGRRERFDAVPFFWSLHFGLDVDYLGHAERWDRIEIVGDISGKDALLFYHEGGRITAVASVLAMGSAAATRRQRQNLRAEVAMEQGGHVTAAAGGAA